MRLGSGQMPRVFSAFAQRAAAPSRRRGLKKGRAGKPGHSDIAPTGGRVVVGIAGGDITASASFSFSLADPQPTPDGRITLGEFRNAVTTDPTSLIDNLSVSASADFTQMTIDVAGFFQLSGNFTIS